MKERSKEDFMDPKNLRNLTGEMIFVRHEKEWFPIEPEGKVEIKKETYRASWISSLFPGKDYINKEIIKGLANQQEGVILIVPFEVKSRMVGVRDDLVTIPFDASHRDDGIYCTLLSW